VTDQIVFTDPDDQKFVSVARRTSEVLLPYIPGEVVGKLRGGVTLTVKWGPRPLKVGDVVKDSVGRLGSVVKTHNQDECRTALVKFDEGTWHCFESDLERVTKWANQAGDD